MCELHMDVLILNPQRKSSLFEQTFVQIQCILQECGKKGFSMLQKKGIPFTVSH